MEVKLRALTADDAVKSVVWRNTPDIWVHTKFKATREITLQDELDWISRVSADATSARFAIVADEVYVGNIYLTDIKDKSAEYHIFIGDRNYWGKGIARRASILILDYAKIDLSLGMVYLNVKKENIGAFKLYQSLGFIETGKSSEGFIRMELKFES